MKDTQDNRCIRRNIVLSSVAYQLRTIAARHGSCIQGDWHQPSPADFVRGNIKTAGHGIRAISRSLRLVINNDGPIRALVHRGRIVDIVRIDRYPCDQSGQCKYEAETLVAGVECGFALACSLFGCILYFYLLLGNVKQQLQEQLFHTYWSRAAMKMSKNVTIFICQKALSPGRVNPRSSASSRPSWLSAPARTWRWRGWEGR